MKALVYTGPTQLKYQDVADPVQNDGTQLFRIDSVGICGSDMHAFLGHDERRPAPCLLYTSPSPRDKRQSRMPSSA